MRLRFLLGIGLVMITAACTNKKTSELPNVENPAKTAVVPAFNSDSAYFYIQAQVSFGPRIPNTKAHQQTGDYLVHKLRSFNAQVITQDFEVDTYDHQHLYLRNIVASYFPEKQKRILLAAHWDTRPFADKDKQKSLSTFDGANDGGSGVGVLMEIARVLKNNKAPDVGVDLIFFDGEDWGEKIDEAEEPLRDNLESWWCLGSQYWAKKKHRSNYAAYFCILLDMVGAKNAQFYREGHSLEFAPTVVEKVWNTAAHLGYSHVFVKQNQSPITDDHLFINSIGKIPAIDVVHFERGLGYFGSFHHSKQDNMEIIGKETLRAVGETVVNVVYNESN